MKLSRLRSGYLILLWCICFPSSFSFKEVIRYHLEMCFRWWHTKQAFDKSSRTQGLHASELLWMAPALLTTLPARMSLRSLKWSLLLLSLLSFLVMWYLSLPHYNVVERVNWMYFYEYEPIYRQDFRFTLREHSNCSHQNPFLVILVTSHPSDVKARQAIRVTWGEKKSWWGYEVLTFFLLGQQAERKTKC